MSEKEDLESYNTLEVTIPENSEAGDTITIQCPNDSYVEFVAPHNVVPGDTVHVTVSDSVDNLTPEYVLSSNAHVVPVSNSYRGVAAVTTGVIVSALVIGPVVTGIFVVGMVVCAAQGIKSASVAPATSENQLEEGGADPECAAPDQPTLAPEPAPLETREQKIAASLVKTADYIADKWCAIDERYAISGSTLKALATVQEMDERNKISETVVTKVKAFDERYQVSEKASNAVTATITKVHELDETCKISENACIAGNNIALAGSSLVGCVGDLERRYDITSRITTALIFAMSTVSETVTAYMHRLANASTATADPVPTAESGVDVEEGGGGGEEYTPPMSVLQAEEEVFPIAPSHPVVLSEPASFFWASAVSYDDVPPQDSEPSAPAAYSSAEIPV